MHSAGAQQRIPEQSAHFNKPVGIYFLTAGFIYYAEFCYKDVTMLVMSMSGWMFDSLLHNMHYMGQKLSLQYKECGNIEKPTTPALRR